MKLKSWSKLTTFFLVLLAVFFAWQLYQKHKTAVVRRPVITYPSASANSPSPTTNPLPHCIDETKISAITGKNYGLIRETPLPEIQAVECQYETDQDVRNVTPALHYILYKTDSAQQWSDKKTEVSALPGFRVIAGQDNFFAYVNPVAEISQGSFYGKNDHYYLALDYTPVDDEVGVLLDKGVKLLELILGNQ